jgi:hypothetical protein
MAVTNHERVGRALALLTDGLAAFVARECKARYGEHWVGRVARHEWANPKDAQFLLGVVNDQWHEISGGSLAVPSGPM